MRRPHLLKRTQNTELPSHAIWFDTETRADKRYKDKVHHILTFGWAAYRRRRSNGKWTKPDWHRFETADQFFAWVERQSLPKTKLYLFCHNTSFDLPVLDSFRHFALRGWSLDTACIDAPPTILKLHKGGRPSPSDGVGSSLGVTEGTYQPRRSIVVLDTLNIFRMPLKDLGRHIGLEKFDMPSVEERSAAGDKYCKRDVEIIMEATIKWWDFLKDNELGGFAPTLAGQALRTFRHRFMNHNILIDNNEAATSLSRRAYYGGRTECFRLGAYKGNFTLLDINSMYPSVMHHREYPIKLVGHSDHCTIADVKRWMKTRLVSARVTVKTDQPIYPFRAKDKLIFPTGTFETVLSTPEVMHALAHGHLHKVHECATYNAADIFSEFVSFFTSRRVDAQQRGDTTNALLYKTLGNSLYGKFGQRGLIWEEHGHTDDLRAAAWESLDMETGKVTRFRQLGGLIQQQHKEQESRDSFPAIAAHVTAYARLLLWDMINEAGREEVYYVDTDSLLVTELGLARLSRHIDATRLGALKVEGRYKDIEIFGAKDYRFGDKTRTKGVKKSATWLDRSTVQQQQWSSLKGLLNTGSISRPVIVPVTKRLSRKYNKGELLSDGRVQPFLLRPGAVSGS